MGSMSKDKGLTEREKRIKQALRSSKNRPKPPPVTLAGPKLKEPPHG